MIANATRSVLYEDRAGRIVIESSFIPDAEDIITTFADAEPFSDEESLLSDAYVIPYATLEDSYTRVDDRMYFLPRNHSVPLEDVAFVSLNGGGAIEVYFGAQWTFYNLGIEFSENLPDTATVEAWSENVKVDEFAISEFELITTINREFIDVDKVRITLLCSTCSRALFP